MVEKESESYQNMLQEVESLVQEIATANLDLDVMVSKVERGYTLIKTMRGRLDDVKGKIETLQNEYVEQKSS